MIAIAKRRVRRVSVIGDDHKTPQMHWPNLRYVQSAALLKWVLPLQAVKACEVPVRRAQLESVFNGECGEVGVGHEIRAALYAREERSQNLLVALCRQWDPD